MTTLHSRPETRSQFDSPRWRVVGPVEWVEVQTRLYGIDSAGNVFVFKPPFTTPRHKSTRRRGHLFRRVYRAYRAGVRRAARHA